MERYTINQIMAIGVQLPDHVLGYVWGEARERSLAEVLDMDIPTDARVKIACALLPESEMSALCDEFCALTSHLAEPDTPERQAGELLLGKPRNYRMAARHASNTTSLSLGRAAEEAAIAKAYTDQLAFCRARITRTNEGTTLDSAITSALTGMGSEYRHLKEQVRMLDDLIDYCDRTDSRTAAVSDYCQARETLHMLMDRLQGRDFVYVDATTAEQTLQYCGYAGTVDSTRAPNHWERTGFRPGSGATMIINVQEQTLCIVDRDGEYASPLDLGYTGNAIRRLYQNWLDTQ